MRIFCCLLLGAAVAAARQQPTVCGNHAARSQEELYLHRQARKNLRRQIATLPDSGQIAVLDDSGGVVARRNAFNLSQRTLRFVPSGGQYSYQLDADTYDSAAAATGTIVAGIGDDDSRMVVLPFSFPFYGVQYQSIFVNSDGNLTFGSGDPSAAERSLGRVTSGPPRIAPLFEDLNPLQATTGITTLSEAGRFVVSWVGVPEYGPGSYQTFQVRLYPDGRIEIVLHTITTSQAVVGIAPGGLKGTLALVDFANTPSAQYGGAVAERFTNIDEIDIYTAAQKFYLNHDDSYDYLVFYNVDNVSASASAVAYESTIRNVNRSGYGDVLADDGFEAGSAKRLQAILNMGPLSQYSVSPTGSVPARLITRDTPLTILSHEAGHLFLALATVPGLPMLDSAQVHWSFNFNSGASIMYGNRFQDNGTGTSPRFESVGITEGYSTLDQYLMGFVPPSSVPDTFLVLNSGVSRDRPQQLGVTMNGTRADIHVGDLISAVGRRVPDSTVSQRHFRFAIVLIVPAGQQATAGQMSQLDTLRAAFEGFYNQISGGNGFADTGLRKALNVTTWPAAGVIAGSTATGKIAVSAPVPSALTIALRPVSGLLTVPASVTIPAGSQQVTFPFTGAQTGVDDLVATPSDAGYDTAYSRIQVAAPQDVMLTGTYGPAVQIRVTDINQLPYSNVAVSATVSGGGKLDASSAVTDENGIARFNWTQGSGTANLLSASIAAGAKVTVTAPGPPTFGPGSVVNAASFVAGITPGSIATIFGVNLAGATLVTVNGSNGQVFYADNQQINFLVPGDVTGASASVIVTTPTGFSPAVSVPVVPVSPGIFGVIVLAGGYVEIFATGLPTNGPAASVTIGGVPANVLYSGLAPGYQGLYQVNAQIPPGVASGPQVLSISLGGVKSNDFTMQVP